MKNYQWVTLLVGLVGFTLLARVYSPEKNPPVNPLQKYIVSSNSSNSRQLESVQPMVLVESSNSSIPRSLPAGARIEAYSCGGKGCYTGTPLAPEPLGPTWRGRPRSSQSS